MDDSVSEDMTVVHTIERSKIQNVDCESSAKSEYYDILMIPPNASDTCPLLHSENVIREKNRSLDELGNPSGEPESPSDDNVMVEELTLKNFSSASLSSLISSGCSQKPLGGASQSERNSFCDSVAAENNYRTINLHRGHTFTSLWASPSTLNYSEIVDRFQKSRNLVVSSGTEYHSEAATTADGGSGPEMRHPDNLISHASGSTSSAAAEGVNLREWLKPGSHKDKMFSRRMYIFDRILNYVDAHHAQGIVLRNLWPSCFELIMPCNDVRYLGSSIEKKDGANTLMQLQVKKPRYSLSDNEWSSRWRNVNGGLEVTCYASPEQSTVCGCTFSSNVYQLGVLLFELLNTFETEKSQATGMLNLRHRILPPQFLAEYPKEAGFCLWLLHPDPSSRPTTREIVKSKIIRGRNEDAGSYDRSPPPSPERSDDPDADLLLHFLREMEERTLERVSRLTEEIRCVEADIEEVEKRHAPRVVCSGRVPRSVTHLETAYFSTRSASRPSALPPFRTDTDVIGIGEGGAVEDRVGAFFDGLCKYARYTRIEPRAVLRSGELSGPASNVICSLSFDRDGEFLAAAGVPRKIKVFDFHSLLTRPVDVHYPLSEMSNASKLSCVSWNAYIKSHLASSDYDGTVKLWDACTGACIARYAEHRKRAWSVDFSMLDPMRLASASDDCTVKLWSMNERRCVGTIRSGSNVCCVQFSPGSSHLVSFGSADYKTYCYDVRSTRVPWCVLSGHARTVSYTKFLDGRTLVSASTDSTLKVWDLRRNGPDACSLTLAGHTNEKNFTGLSASSSDGYVVCGSETDRVYAYHMSTPVPITSCPFDPDPEPAGQFVSSVCWRRGSDMIVAANSSGCIKVLQIK